MKKDPKYCKLCNNFGTQECSVCKEGADTIEHFVPKEEYRKYFRRVYTGNDRQEYMYNSSHPDLAPTDTVEIDGVYHCPYCGDRSFPVEPSGYTTKVTSGYCCFCSGAKSEIVYKEEKLKLKQSYEESLVDLDLKYKDSLRYDTKKLLEIQHEMEIHSHNFHKPDYINHISVKKDLGIVHMDKLRKLW